MKKKEFELINLRFYWAFQKMNKKPKNSKYSFTMLPKMSIPISIPTSFFFDFLELKKVHRGVKKFVKKTSKRPLFLKG
jgi:hypothetical protein